MFRIEKIDNIYKEKLYLWEKGTPIYGEKVGGAQAPRPPRCRRPCLMCHIYEEVGKLCDLCGHVNCGRPCSNMFEMFFYDQQNQQYIFNILGSKIPKIQ